MKDILDMKQSKNWAHKTSSWKYLTIYRFVLQFFPKHRESHFCSPPWAPFKTCWKSAAAASHDLILAEVYGKCQLLFSRSVVSDSLGLHGVQPTRLLCPWDFPGKKSGAGCRCLLQGIFLTQGSNLRLVHWQGDSSALGHQRSLSTWLGNGNTEDNNDNGVTISSRDGKHLHSGYWLPGSALSIWYRLSLLSS